MATAKQRTEFVHGSPDDHAIDILNLIDALDQMAIDGVWSEERIANATAHLCGGHMIVMVQILGTALDMFGDNRTLALEQLRDVYKVD